MTTHVTKPPLPVDTGWAWLIMFGCFIINFMCVGFVRSQSLLLIVLLEKFKGPATQTTMAFGSGEIGEAVTSVLLPVFLLPRFTVRTLCLAGSVIFSTAVMAMAFADNIIVFNFLFAMVGVSRGLILNSGCLMLGYYFRRRLGLANGVAFAGLSLATLGSPLLTQYFLETYGLSGTLMLLGAITTNGIAASLLFRPLSMYSEEENDDEEKEEVDRRESLHAGGPQSNTDCGENRHSYCEENSNLDEEILNAHNDTEDGDTIHNGHLDAASSVYRELSDPSSGEYSPVNQEHNSKSLQNITYQTQESNMLICGEHIFISGTTDYVGLIDNIPSSDAKRTSIKQIKPVSNPESDSVVSLHEKKKDKKPEVPPVSFRSVLSNPIAVMIVLGAGLGVHTQGSSTFMPVLGKENGMDDHMLPWLLTVAGVCDIFGKLLTGWLADRGPMWPLYLVIITQTIPGTVFQFTWFYQGEGLMFMMASLFGLTGGCLASLLVPIIIKLDSVASLPHVMAAFGLVCGGVTAVMQLGVGGLKDATGSFRPGYNLIGGLMISGAAVFSCWPLFQKCQRRRKRTTVQNIASETMSTDV